MNCLNSFSCAHFMGISSKCEGTIVEVHVELFVRVILLEEEEEEEIKLADRCRAKPLHHESIMVCRNPTPSPCTQPEGQERWEVKTGRRKPRSASYSLFPKQLHVSQATPHLVHARGKTEICGIQVRKNLHSHFRREQRQVMEAVQLRLSEALPPATRSLAHDHRIRYRIPSSQARREDEGSALRVEVVSVLPVCVARAAVSRQSWSRPVLPRSTGTPQFRSRSNS